MKTLEKYEVAVVIPALNEEADIDRVVRSIAQYACPLVVDDGSSDRTALFARTAGAEVIIHSCNKGYDAALEAGLFRAIELGFDYAITMDGDGQHVPVTLELFKKKLADGVDLVLGVRDRHQRFAEFLFSVISSWRWGLKDPLCGMKGYRLKLIAKVGYFGSYKSIGTEFSLRAAKSNCRIEQVSVPIRKRSGKSRFGAGFRANWKILRALVLGLLLTKPLFP